MTPRPLSSAPSAERTVRTSAAVLAIGAGLVLSSLVACEGEKPKGEAPPASASAAPPVSAAPSAAGAAGRGAVDTMSPPHLAIDDTGASVASDRVDFAAPDPKGALGLALANRRLAGSELDLDAARNTKMQKVATLFSALSAAKVKSVRVRTAKRDGSQAELVISVAGKLEPCAGVGMIGKDLAIRAWTAGGGAGARYSKGMAGPDNTLGSAGIRKVIDACSAPAWGLTADDTVTWGLVVDLALAVMNVEDAGPPGRTGPREIVLLPTSIVAGRKVESTF